MRAVNDAFPDEIAQVEACVQSRGGQPNPSITWATDREEINNMETTTDTLAPEHVPAQPGAVATELSAMEGARV